MMEIKSSFLRDFDERLWSFIHADNSETVRRYKIVYKKGKCINIHEELTLRLVDCAEPPGDNAVGSVNYKKRQRDV